MKFVRHQIMRLWGSRGVARRVFEMAKSNVPAAMLYMTALLVPAIGQENLLSVRNALERFLPFGGTIEFLLISVFLLAVSLFLWARPVAVREYMREFFAAFLTVALATPLNAILLIILFNVIPDVAMAPIGFMSRVLLTTYATCLFARVAISAPFNFRLPQHIFFAVLTMTAGVQVVGYISFAILGYLTNSSLMMFLQAAIMMLISTFVFIATMMALARHRLKVVGS